MDEVREAAAAFIDDGDRCTITPLGSGNINDTYLVQGHGQPFVLQRINCRVFPQPLRVITNFATITAHLQRASAGKGVEFRTAMPVRARHGGLGFLDSQGEFWRAQTYIEHSAIAHRFGLPEAREIGRVLATFHRLAAALSPGNLGDPLPGFHDLPDYLAHFDAAPRPGSSADEKTVKRCCAAIERFRPLAFFFSTAKARGLVAPQIVHGDPKIDNFIFTDAGLAAGMLDLDTVGSGLVHLDLGDCLRSTCNLAGEGGTGPVVFDLAMCQAILAGYCGGHDLPMPEEQREMIFEAVLLLAFELGLRFFTDHLQGDGYFKVGRRGENLARAIRQFRLAEDIAAKEAEIRAIAAGAGK
jgi:hypothetical protein